MKKIIAIFFCYCLSIYGNSQPIYFNNRYGFTEYKETEGCNIVTMPDGYIILANAVDSQWYYYLEIMKIDTMGNEIWKKIYGKKGNDYITGVGGSLITTYDGNLVSAGSFIDSSGKFYSQLFIFNTDGDTLWTKRYNIGGNSGNASYNCKQTSDSGFVLIGDSDVNDPNLDILLIKTDKNGNLQWEKTYGGGGVEYGFYVIVTEDSGYLLSGYTNSFGAGAYDTYVIKTDNSGNVKWSNTYGGAGIDGGFNFIKTKNGGFIGCGSKLDTVLLPGTWDLIQNWVSIIKIDSSGNFIWQKKYGPSRYAASLISIHELYDGSFVASGQSNNNKGTPNGNGWPIGVILKVDSNGDSLWYREHQYDTCEKNFDYFRDMKPTSDGGFIVAGFFTPNTSFQCNDTGTQDMWVIKLDSCGCAYLGCDSACQGLTGIKELQVQSSEFRVEMQPNPSKGKFYVEIFNSAEGEKPCEIKMYDVFGKNILKKESSLNKTSLDISGQPAGVYLMQVKSEQNNYYGKVVKQ